MNDSLGPENSLFDKSPRHFADNFPDPLDRVPEPSRKLSRNILEISKERKGSILKRSNNPNIFQRSTTKNRTVAFSTMHALQNRKRDTIENLKKSFASELARKPMENENIYDSSHHYFIENSFEPMEYEYDAEKIQELLHEHSQNRHLTFVSTGAQRGDYQFYAIKEQQQESFSSVQALSDTEMKNPMQNSCNSKGNNSKTQENNKSFGNNNSEISRIFFDESEEQSSKSSLGFHPQNSKGFGSQKKRNKKEIEKKKLENKQKNYLYFQDFLHSTINPSQEELNNNIEENQKLKKEVTEIPDLFRQHTKIIHKRKPEFLKIVEMSEIEKIHYDFDDKNQKNKLIWCKTFRKNILLGVRYSQIISKKIAESKPFQLFSLLIIFLNCITYSLLRNQRNNYRAYTEHIKNLEFFFFIFYLIEATLKILSSGLIAKKHSYLRSGWNILDFIVIIALILSYSEIFPTFDFTILRSLRLFRPLRTVTSFMRLQIILSALFSALPLFFDALFILLFTYSLYATVGLQLFAGILKNHCIYSQTGLQVNEEICGNLECGPEMFCGKGLKNEFSDVMNFDNAFSCFLQVLFVVTLDNWTTIMYSIQKAFTNFAWIYFVSLVILGAYMMNNLLLAVIKVKFSESQNYLLSGKDKINEKNKQKHKENTKFYDFTLIKREGLWRKKQEVDEKKENIGDFNGKIKENNNKFEDFALIPMPLLNLQLVQEDERTPVSKYSSLIKQHSTNMKNSTRKSKTSILSPQIRRFSGNNYKKPMLISKDSVFSLISPTHKLSSDGNFSGYFSSLVSTDEKKQKQSNFQDKILAAFKEIASLRLKKKLLNFFNYGKIKRQKRKSRLFAKLRPEYLKLIVDHGKDFESSSENDVLLRKKRQKEQILQELENEIKEIQSKKVPFRYTLKKNMGLFDVLHKFYSKQNQKTVMDSSESNEFLKYIQQRTFFSKNTLKSPRNPLKPLTQGIYSKKKTMIRSPEHKSIENNNNFAIKIRNKREKSIDKKARGGRINFAKSINKSIEMFSLNKHRRKPGVIDQEEKIFQILREKNTESYNYIKNLIKSPLEIYGNKGLDVENQGNEEEEDGFLDMAKEYLRIRKQDLVAKIAHSYIWSGQDVLKNSFNFMQFAKIFQALNSNLLSRYIMEAKGKLIFLKTICRKINDNIFYQNLSLIFVFSYIIISALEGSIRDEELFLANFIFVIIFLMDFVIKIIWMGINHFLLDKINVLEMIILYCSILEIILVEVNFLNTFRYIRFLTAIKILRISRLFKNIQFFRFIVVIILKTIAPCFYLIILLFLFNYVYALIGMQLFGGVLNQNDDRYSKNNFDTFWVAYLTCFNIITLDNWIDTVVLTFNSSAGKLISIFFIVSWIIFGNFILLNILLAIILEGFTENMESENQKQLVDEEQIEAERENFRSKIISDQELTILLPKNEREIFMEELTKHYVKTIRMNNKEIDKETQLIADLIMETQKKKERNPEKKYFGEICQNSLFFFQKSGYVRKKIVNLLVNTKFNFFILTTISVSCMIMIGESYVDKNTNDSFDISIVIFIKVLNGLCLAIFILEMIIKVIAFGFCMHKNSYLRKKENILDFLIIFSYFVDIIFYETAYSELSITNIVRTLRILRPVRFVIIFPNLRLLVAALFESASGILNFFLLLITIWLTFGVLGIILFRDRFGFCENKLNFNVGIDSCPPDRWMNYPFNFDNIFNAFLTLFVLSTIDGWSETMNIAVNSDLAKNGPSEFNNQYSAYIFFLSFIFIGTLFLINVFIGIIFYNFTMSSRRNKHKFLSESQLSWLQLHRSIIIAEPHFLYKKPPSGSIRLRIYYLIRTNMFRRLINIFLFLNFLVLVMPYEDSSKVYADVLGYIQVAFNFILIIEATLKILALGYSSYMYPLWNRFEFFIMITAVCDLLIQSYFLIYFDQIKIGRHIVKGLRILRILRLAKVIHQKKGIERLIKTLLVSFPMLLNIFCLLFLVYFIFGMMACYYFGDIHEGKIIDNYINFKNLAYSIMTLIKVSTADDWSSIMLDVMRKKTDWAALFFVLFYIISSYLLVNLFILVLIRQFENYCLNPDNPIHSFNHNLEKFRNVWSLFTVRESGIRLKEKNLVNFFITLKAPLGFNKDEDIDTILKEIARMKLFIDHQQYIYFNELLFCTLKRVYWSQIDPGQNQLAKKEIAHFEEMTRLKLQIKKKTRKREALKKFSLNTTNYLKHMIKNLREYNPLPNYFYSKMIFYTWRHYANLTFEKLNAEKKLYFETSDSEEDERNIANKCPPQNPQPSLNFGQQEIFEEPIANPIRSLQEIPNIIITKNE